LSLDASVNLGKSYDLTQKMKCPFGTGIQSLNHFALLPLEFKVACSGHAYPAYGLMLVEVFIIHTSIPREKDLLTSSNLFFRHCLFP
jgi:hypothetical protein